MPPRILPSAVVTVSGGVAVVAPVFQVPADGFGSIPLPGLDAGERQLDPGRVLADPREPVDHPVLKLIHPPGQPRLGRGLLRGERAHRGEHVGERRFRRGSGIGHGVTVPATLNVVPQSIETARQNPIWMENRT